ncbi:hypothetical protein EV186_103626 [Labedaea rhizosphaerae]|uniref:Uncharacterized protein n=1 Tax=Labedaea rhizosphaerae TaxID=598644 RepID=A0A4R6SCI9_LABRH|nr:hypothetical protein EV186_103626 [Labedaea rhizosphaerae]
MIMLLVFIIVFLPDALTTWRADGLQPFTRDDLQ